MFTYLEDQEVIVAGGYKIYGSPCQSASWAFNRSRGEASAQTWKKIPSDTDILLTHGPPIGHGDLCTNGKREGCVDLLANVTDRVKPLFHVFGHIHEGYGATTNGTTTFVNASQSISICHKSCPHRYQSNHPPLVFDLPVKT